MSRARWRNQIDPPVVLGTALLLTAVVSASSIGAAAAGPLPVGCPPVAEITQAAARQIPVDAQPPSVSADLTAAGEFTGQTLSLATQLGPRSIGLPAESFVGRPVGELVVYTSYTPARGSAVRLVDLATGCDVLAASPAEIVRSAVVSPDGGQVYVHSVTRAGRRDNGVQRVELATGASELVVPPLPPSDEFGPTFATELRWSLNGSHLAVQSCSFEACRTRVLAVADGGLATFDAPGQGALVGLTDSHLVTFAACPGLPCAVLSIDLASGQTAVLAEVAWSAALESGPGGSGAVTIETAAGTTEVTQ
jgi:hypothetical protein